MSQNTHNIPILRWSQRNHSYRAPPIEQWHTLRKDGFIEMLREMEKERNSLRIGSAYLKAKHAALRGGLETDSFEVSLEQRNGDWIREVNYERMVREIEDVSKEIGLAGEEHNGLLEEIDRMEVEKSQAEKARKR